MTPVACPKEKASARIRKARTIVEIVAHSEKVEQYRVFIEFCLSEEFVKSLGARYT
jgi:hypothetical protein